MREIIERYDINGIEKKYHRLLTTGINDASEMLQYYPAEALPAVRFITIQYHRLIFSCNPLDLFAEGKMLPDACFNKALGVCVPDKIESDTVVQMFLKFFTRLGNELSEEFGKIWTSRIGTKQLFTHIIETYDAVDLLPHLSENKIREWMREVAATGT